MSIINKIVTSIYSSKLVAKPLFSKSIIAMVVTSSFFGVGYLFFCKNNYNTIELSSLNEAIDSFSNNSTFSNSIPSHSIPNKISKFNYQGKLLSPLIVKLSKEILDQDSGLVKIKGQVATSSFQEFDCQSNWILPNNVRLVSGNLEESFEVNRQLSVHNFEVVLEGFDLSKNENSFFKVEFTNSRGQTLGQNFTLPSREDLTQEHQDAARAIASQDDQEHKDFNKLQKLNSVEVTTQHELKKKRIML